MTLGWLMERVCETQHIIRKMDVLGCCGIDPDEYREDRERNVMIHCHKWAEDREPGSALSKIQEMRKNYVRIKSEPIQ